MHKEMQATKKKAKFSIPGLLSVIVKMKFKECWFRESELWPRASKPPREGEILQGQHKVPLRPVVAKKVVNVVEGQG